MGTYSGRQHFLLGTWRGGGEEDERRMRGGMKVGGDFDLIEFALLRLRVRLRVVVINSNISPERQSKRVRVRVK